MVCYTWNHGLAILDSVLTSVSSGSIKTVGVNFMEKKVKIRDASVTFSIWDLGGTF